MESKASFAVSAKRGTQNLVWYDTVTLLKMIRHVKQIPFSQLIIIGLVGLLSLQLTGLSCLHEWVDIASSDEVQVISTSSNDANHASQERLDACPCHVTIAQGESLLLPVAFHHTGTISHTPVDYVSPMIALLFHPPISA
ncbi:MAG: hypothetical protein K2Q17_13070 [Nitrospiraceae bacterium]|nr:hypothetical protein [Nitrospiraceae bacterium]